MNDSLLGLKFVCSIYLDDIILYNTCIEQYLGHPHIILSHLHGCILSVKCLKSDFLKTSPNSLDHVISPGWLGLEPPKVAAICDMATPTDFWHLYLLLWCTNFHERFVPCYATVYALLINLLGSHTQWYWGPI